MSERCNPRFHRGIGDGMYTQDKRGNTGSPFAWFLRRDQPDFGDGQAGRVGVADRPVIPEKPGNAGGGKGP